MKLNEKIAQLQDFVREKFSNESTGHDWFHIERVMKVAVLIAEKEGADKEMVCLTAILHDIDDHKFNGGDFSANSITAKRLLKQFDFDQSIINTVGKAVSEISYKGSGVSDYNSTLISKIVQDADRIDALGAIGIARTFAYGGSVGQPMYNPNIAPKNHNSAKEYYKDRTHTINHFYEKLLLLKDRMHTDTAKKIADKRHCFMEDFLHQFYSEWKALDEGK
jgi:uncharacterized protein